MGHFIQEKVPDQNSATYEYAKKTDEGKDSAQQSHRNDHSECGKLNWVSQFPVNRFTPKGTRDTFTVIDHTHTLKISRMDAVRQAYSIIKGLFYACFKS